MALLDRISQNCELMVGFHFYLLARFDIYTVQILPPKSHIYSSSLEYGDSSY
jgi:hypothetical protein